MTQKITLAAIVTLLFLAIPAKAQEVKNTFSDVGPEDPYFLEVEYLAREGVLEGYEDGSFGKEKMANRAELVTMMVRGKGIEPDLEKYRDCFPFVKNEWHARYICYAKEKGWISGHADGFFRPGDEATGWEAAKIVINPFFKEEIEAQTEEEIKSQMSAGHGVHEDDWHAPYSAFIFSRRLGRVNPSNRGWVAQLLFKTKLTKEQGWPAYHDYRRDKYLTETSGLASLIESQSNGCYKFTNDLSLPFLDDYLQNEYGFTLQDQIFDLPRTVKPPDLESGHKVYMSHFCVLKNGHFKVTVTHFPHQNTNEPTTRHMITFDTGGEKINEDTLSCSAFEGISTMLNYVVSDISDPETHEFVDCYYSKDKDYVYPSDDLIKGANPDIFESLSYPYSKDDKRVYCRYWEIEGADSQSFERITLSSSNNIGSVNILNYNKDPLAEAIKLSYAKDNHNVYHSCKPIEGSDPDTFQILSDYYAKDQNQVYYQFFDSMAIMGADPESFEVLSENYSKDKDHVYYDGRLIEQADPTTFEILTPPYSRDAERVYIQEHLAPGANPETFSLFGEDSSYSTDGRNIYFGGNLIEGADLETFEALEDNYSKDKNYIYQYSRVAEINNYFNPDYPSTYDVNTFEVLNSRYTKDKNGIYYRDWPVEEADIETFETLDVTSGTIGKDKAHVFYKGRPLTFDMLDLSTAALTDSSILKAYTLKDANNVYCHVMYYELEESYCEQK